MSAYSVQSSFEIQSRLDRIERMIGIDVGGGHFGASSALAGASFRQESDIPSETPTPSVTAGRSRVNSRDPMAHGLLARIDSNVSESSDAPSESFGETSKRCSGRI